MDKKIAEYLKKAKTLAWIARLIPLPFSLIIATAMSKLVSAAASGMPALAVSYSAILLAAAGAQCIFNVLIQNSFEKALALALHKCKIALYADFLSNPLHILYASKQGDNLERLNDDFNTVTGKITSLYPTFITGIIISAAYLVFISRGGLTAALIMPAISLLQILPPQIIKRFMQINYDKCRDIEAEITDMVAEGFNGFATIKMFDLKKWWIGRLKLLHGKYIKIGGASIYAGTAERALYTFVENILKYGTYGILGMLVLLKNISTESAVQCIALSGGFFAAVKSIFALIPGFATAETAERRLFELLKAPGRGEDDLADGKEIIFSNVSFAYDELTVLKDYSATFDMNAIYILKGPNGVGKSTIFRLIAGLLACDGGVIRAGVTASEQKNSFSETVFYLPQDDYDFSFTPESLYKMALPGGADGAAEYAGVFGLSEAQLQNTPIRELSGGDRKKVFLALAFAAKPKFMLLDEPTNSLDAESREVLAKLLRRRMCGAIIITHTGELDSIADSFMTLGAGEIARE
jgi:ABC-type multidrug transport system fused ATPase/permease subunit